LNLLETSAGTSLWSHAFDVRFRDIFEFEDEIARQVATQLRFHFDSTQAGRLAQHHTRNPEAYEHYLKGIYSYEMRNVSGSSRAGIEAAIARFKRAVELDASYAQAYAQLAICYSELMNFYEPGGNAAAEAQSAASHAYVLDPDLPELRVFRAWMFWSWDGHYRVEDAIRELRRATDYNSSAVHSMLGGIYSHAGLDKQAVRELNRAIEIDPTNSLHMDRLAEAYVWAGRYDDARAAYTRALEIEPDAQASIAFSAIPFLYARQFDETRRRLERAKAHDLRNIIAPSYISLLAAFQGNFQEAESGIPPVSMEMEKRLGSHHAFYAFASIHALQGESTEAVRWLRKAVETGMPNYPMFARDPNLAPIRTSAEYVGFMTALKPRWDAMDREFR
jgi:tetratricopeptide (TPR) repeat protein